MDAAYSKNDREDTLPVREDTAGLLSEHTVRHMPQAEVFCMPDGRGAEMVRADLENTGDEERDLEPIKYRDSAGRKVDFHSLRHTFLTNLANSGVHPKTAQMLARHSTIRLTMDRYTHSVLSQQSEAVAKLPALQVRGKSEQQCRTAGGMTAPPGAHAGAKSGHQTAPNVTNCHESPESEKGPSNPETGVKGRNKMVRSEGIDPPANGLKVR